MSKKEDVADRIGLCRCRNRPVASISRSLGIRRQEIEKAISRNILETDEDMAALAMSAKPSGRIPEIGTIIEKALRDGTDRCSLFMDDQIISYIAMKRSDHHDRMMDCLRYIWIRCRCADLMHHI